jgi:hypothetical protein
MVYSLINHPASFQGWPAQVLISNSSIVGDTDRDLEVQESKGCLSVPGKVAMSDLKLFQTTDGH